MKFHCICYTKMCTCAGQCCHCHVSWTKQWATHKCHCVITTPDCKQTYQSS